MTPSFKVNLFVVGVMKGGTSALHNMLAYHPNIAMSREKEPCHFAVPASPDALLPKGGRFRDPDVYHAEFPVDSETKIIGESSPHYSMRRHYPDVPERIHAYNPDSKIIYLVREPVARIVSQYLQLYRVGRETLPILEAVRDVPHYVDVSDYRKQIRPFIDLFSRENVKILISERFKNNPQPYIQEIHEWLGLDYVPPPSRGNSVSDNITPPRVGKPRRLFKTVQERLYRLKLWRRVSKAMPGGLKDALRPLLYSDMVKGSDVPYEALRELVGPEADRIRREVQELLDDPVPEWD